MAYLYTTKYIGVVGSTPLDPLNLPLQIFGKLVDIKDTCSIYNTASDWLFYSQAVLFSISLLL